MAATMVPLLAASSVGLTVGQWASKQVVMLAGKLADWKDEW